MSDENVEIVREWIDCFNRGGLEEALRLLDEEVEWTTTGAYLESGTYQGHDGVRRFVRRAAGGWEDPRLEPEGLIGTAENVVVTVRITARDRQSDAVGDFTLAVVAEVQEGVIVRLCNYTDRAEALRAAGLREIVDS